MKQILGNTGTKGCERGANEIKIKDVKGGDLVTLCALMLPYKDFQ